MDPPKSSLIDLEAAPPLHHLLEDVGATSAPVALAWVLAQRDDIAPILGTKRVMRVEEDAAADDLELTPEQLDTSRTSLQRPGPLQRTTNEVERKLTLIRQACPEGGLVIKGIDDRQP